MSCPHLEETSALFDGRKRQLALPHSTSSCGECRAFLVDAAVLRESLQDVTFDFEPRTRLLPILVPAALMLGLALFFFLRDARPDDGPFAGLDGGGRAVIAVKDAR